jgi:hypothetical protein
MSESKGDAPASSFSATSAKVELSSCSSSSSSSSSTSSSSSPPSQPHFERHKSCTKRASIYWETSCTPAATAAAATSACSASTQQQQPQLLPSRTDTLILLNEWIDPRFRQGALRQKIRLLRSDL